MFSYIACEMSRALTVTVYIQPVYPLRQILVRAIIVQLWG